MNITVTHQPDAKQFVSIIDGAIATLSYTVSNDGKTWDYYSTFVPSALRGKHIGQALVKYALTYAKENQLNILPTCPFVKSIIEAHPEYQSLIAK